MTHWPFRVDPPPAGPARHLGQLVRRQGAESPVGALREPLEHDAPRGHVDAQAHGLGGEDHPDEAPLEEHLGQALQARQDPRVVEPDTAPERLEDALVERRGGERRALLDGVRDRLAPPPGCEPVEERPAFLQDLVHRALAPGAAEDEVDRGQPSPALELLEHGRDGRHAARVEAPAPLVAAAVDPHHLGAARPTASSGWISADRSARGTGGARGDADARSDGWAGGPARSSRRSPARWRRWPTGPPASRPWAR